MNHLKETEVCVHGVEVDPIVVVLQPVKQFLVEVELLEAGSGFKDKEKDKLFPRGDGLQIHDILFDVAFRNLGNIFDFLMGVHKGLLDLKWEVGSNMMAVMRTFSMMGIGLTLLSAVNGKATLSFIAFLLHHFGTTERETFTTVGAGTSWGSAIELVTSFEVAFIAKR
jgi:hypothetical protein